LEIHGGAENAGPENAGPENGGPLTQKANIVMTLY